MHTQLENSQARQGQSKKSLESSSPVSQPSTVFVKAQLEMTVPGDSDEQEADEVADSIVSEGKIARSVSSGHPGRGVALPSQFGSRIASFQGQGSSITGDLKTRMESGFGRDFSNVRLHTDSAAAEMSSSISAKAFTYGNDIFFNRGQYNPDTKDGQHLLAHELTHVVQGSGKVERKPAYLSSDDAMINYLIFTATAEEGYVERVDLGSIKDDKLNQFVFGRNFRLREGASIMKALNKEAARMKKEKMSSTEIESIMDSTKRVILKEQSGITVEKALEEEVKILMDRGMDEAEVKGIEDRIRSIIINRIEPAREEGRKKQDKKFYQSFLKEKKKKLVKSAKKKDEYNATTITIIDTIIAELNRGKSISGALEETRKKMMPSEGVVIDIGMGISMADEILGSIRLELLLAYREEERRRYNMSLAGALERERMRAQLKGITGEDDINESINKEIHINDIYDDPDIRNAVFADPDNSKYRTPDGKDNRTKYHDAMRLGMGEKAQWCDHFVHWCFLKAFDPNEFEGWRDKTDKSRNRIRQDILHYAMFETKNGSINETMQGRVHKNIELAGEHAFLSDQFDITRLDSKFKATWSKAVMKETEGKSDYEIVAYKLKNINKATFSSSENRSYWKEYATDYLNLNKSYGRMQESFAQVNLNEDDQKYEVLKSKPQPLKGDVFYLVGHIGIVTGVNETSISTIEGNTDSKGSHSGDGVYRKTRPLSEVMGFGRPDYSGLRTYLSDYYDEQEREKSQDSSQSASQEALSETEVDVNE